MTPSPKHTAEQPDGAEHRAKRPRAAQACDRCRRKKYRCDEMYPCGLCQKHHAECSFQGKKENQRTVPSSYAQHLEQKIRDLTSDLDKSINSEPLRTAPQNGTSVDTFASGDPYFLTPRPEKEWAPLPESEGEEDSPEGVYEVNEHTKGTEYHGSTSAMAVLDDLKRSEKQHVSDLHIRPSGASSSLVSLLHNSAFSPQTQVETENNLVHRENRFYFRQASLFLDGYFGSLQFIHPIIDKTDFLSRAEGLWFGFPTPPSFVALYLSVMSLGALIRVWDEDHIDGLSRLDWSRKLYREAQENLNMLIFNNSLDTVNCLFIMAKICQNELNPHQAYMYLGVAARTALSAGLNRETNTSNGVSAVASNLAASRTWWGLYSLEIEMSWSLGRPDTLGMDEYHNRSLPDIDNSEFAIIPIMVSFARIMRSVSIQIYHTRSTIKRKFELAGHLERTLDSWANNVPAAIRPTDALTSFRDRKWARRQKLVLQIRYYNVKMLMYRPFLAYVARNPDSVPDLFWEAVNKCIESAQKTIEIMHTTFLEHTYFRTWWYNITYVSFPAFLLLLYATEIKSSTTEDSILASVEKAIDILDAMDEAIVARKSAEIIRSSLASFRRRTNLGEIERNDAQLLLSLDTRYEDNELSSELTMLDSDFTNADLLYFDQFNFDYSNLG